MLSARRWALLQYWISAAAIADVGAHDVNLAARRGELPRQHQCSADSIGGDRLYAPVLLQRGSRVDERKLDTAVELATGDFSYGFAATIASTIMSAGLRVGFVGNPCNAIEDCGWHQRCNERGSLQHKEGDSEEGEPMKSDDDKKATGASSSRGFCEALDLGEHIMADFVIGVVSFVIAGISLAAGVGGGGVFVPTLMLTLGLDSRTATALSQSMLLGGATAAFLYNVRHKHPSDESRPLIDFELACLMGPGLMAGAQVGSILHAVAPPALLLGALFLVLGDAARKGMKSAIKLSQKEDRKAAAEIQRMDTVGLDKATRGQDAQSPAEPAPGPCAAHGEGSIGFDDEDERPLVEVHAPEVLFCIWVASLGAILCKGLLLELCSLSWWLLVLGFTWALLLFALYYAHQISRLAPMRGEDGVPDFHQYSFVLMGWSVLAGVLASMCGIGGGMVMGPILVQFSIPPRVSSATTATTLLILSSSVSLVYACRGFAPVDYSLYLSIVTFCGALSGKMLVGYIIKKTKKESLILFFLAGITVSSCVLMGALGAHRMWENGRAAFEFTNLCGDQYNQVANKVIHHDTAVGSNATAAASQPVAVEAAADLLWQKTRRMLAPAIGQA